MGFHLSLAEGCWKYTVATHVLKLVRFFLCLQLLSQKSVAGRALVPIMFNRPQ